MKTAMQTLRDKIREMQETHDPQYWVGLQAVLTVSEELLEKEKEDIMNAFNQCKEPFHGMDAETYFNQTFKQ